MGYWVHTAILMTAILTTTFPTTAIQTVAIITSSSGLISVFGSRGEGREGVEAIKCTHPRHMGLVPTI